MQIKAIYRGARYDLEVDPCEGIEILRYQILSLTDLEPEKQQISFQNNLLTLDESLNALVENSTIFISTKVETGEEQRSIIADLQALQRPISNAPAPPRFTVTTEQEKQFVGRVQSYCRQVDGYVLDSTKSLVLQSVPLDRLIPRAVENCSSCKNKSTSNAGSSSENLYSGLEPCCKEQCVRELLHWFKGEFFTWTKEPPCNVCGGKSTQMGMTRPSEEEARSGASRVELYRCLFCGNMIRFPRYNSVAKLLQTRTGRCGEWAQVFTAVLIAVGVRARFVVDWTDHVWAEIYSEHQNRYLHADPCEDILDRPLTYEKGWGKKLTYVISIGPYEVVDVTRRYTEHYDEVLRRRSAVQETWLQQYLAHANALRLRSCLALDVQLAITRDQVIESGQLSAAARSGPQQTHPEEARARISGSEHTS